VMANLGTVNFSMNRVPPAKALRAP
jgi:hypothetical protein